MDQSVEFTEPQKGADLITIENTPPFYNQIKAGLELPQETIIRNSRKFEEPYLAWQAVRHIGSNGTHLTEDQKLTGFEGYLLDLERPEAIEQEITSIGAHALKGLSRTPLLKNKVAKTLSEEQVYPEALMWLHETLGSITARLRTRVHQNKEAQAFHDATRIRLAGRKITYADGDGQMRQRYQIPNLKQTEALVSTTQAILIRTPGYVFMRDLGKIGHPLVRASLGAYDDQTIHRIRNQMRQ